VSTAHHQEESEMHTDVTRAQYRPITLRRAEASDAQALRRLAALDSAPAPTGATLVAERRGALVAAISADGRSAIADPFVRTADVVKLLRSWSAEEEIAA
jgi:hypothetical protein